jgi:hypothetical protein
MFRLKEMIAPEPPAICGTLAIARVPNGPLWIFEIVTVVTIAPEIGFLSAIEAAALRSLALGEAEQFARQVPGLLLLSIGPYFGQEAAWAEVRRLA